MQGKSSLEDKEGRKDMQRVQTRNYSHGGERLTHTHIHTHTSICLHIQAHTHSHPEHQPLFFCAGMTSVGEHTIHTRNDPRNEIFSDFLVGLADSHRVHEDQSNEEMREKRRHLFVRFSWIVCVCVCVREKGSGRTGEKPETSRKGR